MAMSCIVKRTLLCLSILSMSGHISKLGETHVLMSRYSVYVRAHMKTGKIPHLKIQHSNNKNYYC